MKPIIREREIQVGVQEEALARGYTPLQAAIIGSRMYAPEDVSGVTPSLADLSSPAGLPDIDVAAVAIADAVMDPTKKIVCITDHDCDGASSHAVIKEALLVHFGVPPQRIVSMITHRMKEGYGVSDRFVDRMLEVCEAGSLVITADQGSTDQERIARLKDAGMATVVTDHHGIPEDGPPKDAVACVNPVRKDSRFGDPCIAGVHVAWLVMCAVRIELIHRSYLPQTASRLGDMLDFVALGTCADAVSMARSKNNRAVLMHGLHRMNQSPCRPCWEAMRVLMRKEGALTVKDVGFGISPRVNARSRLGDAMASVDFLLSQTLDEALTAAKVLDGENQARKAIQQSLTGEALAAGATQVAEGRSALCVYFPYGHSGVHGIIASRLVEAYGRPVCCLSPKQEVPGVVTGSLRSVPGVDIRQALVEVARAKADLMLGFGGHAGAAGCSMRVEAMEAFHQAFCCAVQIQADPHDFVPVIRTDGRLDGRQSFETLLEIEALEPYGREFESPLFRDTFRVMASRVVGDGTHLKLELQNRHRDRLQGIWFRAQDAGEEPALKPGQVADLVYALTANTFRGRTTLDLQVSAACPIKQEEVE